MSEGKDTFPLYAGVASSSFSFFRSVIQLIKTWSGYSEISVFLKTSRGLQSCFLGCETLGLF